MNTTNRFSQSELTSVRKRVDTALFKKHVALVNDGPYAHTYARMHTDREYKVFEAVLADYALGLMTTQQVVNSYTILGLPQLLILEAIEEANKTKDDLNA